MHFLDLAQSRPKSDRPLNGIYWFASGIQQSYSARRPMTDLAHEAVVENGHKGRDAARFR